MLLCWASRAQSSSPLTLKLRGGTENGRVHKVLDEDEQNNENQQKQPDECSQNGRKEKPASQTIRIQQFLIHSYN